MSHSKRSKRFERFGDGPYLILQFSIKYLDSDKELTNLRILNKEAKLRLTQVIYKQALLFS